jgi:hypothetical protein
MEEFESQTERVEEHLHEHAHHSGEKWIGGVALTAALLAALAAVAAMKSGDHANHAMVDRIEANDQWSYYQAKKNRATILEDIYKAVGKPLGEEEHGRLEKYKTDEEQIAKVAESKQHSSEHHFELHETLARAVTLFQVAIAVSAISALTRKRLFWFAGIVLGCAGLFFFVKGLLLH